MPDLRKDPIVGRWVIVAANRAKRPQDFDAAPRRRSDRTCPFCEGNESHTPKEVFACRKSGSEPNREGWRVRVVPNKFPALEAEGNLNRHFEGIYEKMQGVGAHEVIIESPCHLFSTSDLTEPQLAEVLSVYRARLRELKQDHRLIYGMIFKNVGPAAGASLEHIHSQLIATPIIPISVWEEMTGSLEFYNYRGGCVYCDMIEQELTDRRRIVLDSPDFVAFCPFASRSPFETWIVPKKHMSHFEHIDKSEIDDLSGVLRRVIGKIEAALNRPAYNYIIHTAPFDTHELGHYHWHIEIMPSVTKAAGFEWGTGFYINPVPPEDAAAVLGKIEPEY